MEALLGTVLAVSGLIWAHLLFARGGFWRADQRLPPAPVPLDAWPAVTAVIPARNEAALIGDTLHALLAQDYPGHLGLVLVDDHSEDGTGQIAAAVAAGAPRNRPLTVVSGAPLPAGWSGKLWAVAQGVRTATETGADGNAGPAYLLLTDADILHDSGSVRRLVAKAEIDRIDLVSQMVLLDKGGFWGRLLIPAFVFFFQKLYPFPWVNNPGKSTAGAAGGCMLVRTAALRQAGGIERIRGRLIDDCALGQAIKAAGGRLWLGLTDRVTSTRPYAGFASIWAMVARTAYTQLHHSPLLLAGSVLGLALTYLAAPVAALGWLWHGSAPLAGAGVVLWCGMAIAFRPTLRLYGEPAWAAVWLPLTAFLYGLMTIDSALRHWRGQGGQWKGRVYGGRGDNVVAAAARSR